MIICVLFISESGKAYTWGWNEYGQLGLGDTRTRDEPTAVQYFEDEGIILKDIFCGAWNTVFMDSDTVEAGYVT